MNRVLAAIVGVLLVTGLVLAILIGQRFASFESGVCRVYSQQRAAAPRFYAVLRTLEAHAVARERVEKQRGDYLAAANDADLARLYLSVLPPAGQTQPSNPLGC